MKIFNRVYNIKKAAKMGIKCTHFKLTRVDSIVNSQFKVYIKRHQALCLMQNATNKKYMLLNIQNITICFLLISLR